MKAVQKVNREWRPDLAYAIGLITTDGSLSADGRHIVLVSKDKEMVVNFRNLLSLKNKIGTRKSGFTGQGTYYHVQFGDIKFYDFLLSIGLTPNKSKTIGQLKIPKKFFPDFLRGHFDGNGYFYSYRDKRWPSSVMFYLNFGSASLLHTQWIAGQIENHWGLRGSMNQFVGVSYIRYAKKATEKIVKKMYYNEFLPSLGRKRKKIEKFVKIE